ncbi:MAG: HDOD domain-containing protein [Myxococcota bacterium]|jgi:putative nucleotidyltransferase with HDIG domain|nr:HDOD domain-containing protein [Myxococcota bacterium]
MPAFDVDSANPLLFDEKEQRASDEASTSVAAKLAEVDGLKTFPAVARQVLSALSGQSFQFGEVASLIEGDPSLAAGVMRMANSAFFSRGKRIAAIDQALVRLGARSVREVVSAVATMDLFPDPVGAGKQIRDHCASVAALSQTLAAKVAPLRVEGLFLSGLLHDIGKLLLIESGECEYDRDERHPDRDHREETSLLGFDHALLGGYVVSRWNLPEPVPRIVTWHHSPKRAYTNGDIGPYVALLRAADHLDSALQSRADDPSVLAEKLIERDDFVLAGIDLSLLKSHWPELEQARRDVLELFSK